MIDRQNWMDTREYVTQYAKMGKDPATVLKLRGALRYLLEWADSTPFPKARSIDPSFQTYLLTARLGGGRPGRMSAATTKKICEYARHFFEYIRGEHLVRYKLLTTSWIETIRPVTSKGMHTEYREHEFWEIEQVRKIAALAPANVTEERDQAAVVFLFLSAMRAQAFVSLPVEAVDLRRLRVSQLPELGVHTKNHKAAKTFLLAIPDLQRVVEGWDAKVRAEGCALWFPRIDRWHRFVGTERELHWPTRTGLLAKGLQRLCERAGVPYLSPHKLRHGHAVYMMRRISDMKALKSLSQNMMHKSVTTTDEIYAPMVRDDVEELYGSVKE